MVDHINEELNGTPIALLIKTFFQSSNKFGADVAALVSYLTEKVSDDESERRFVDMLCNCHPKVYREVCSKLEENGGKSMEDLIKKEFGGK